MGVGEIPRGASGQDPVPSSRKQTLTPSCTSGRLLRRIPRGFAALGSCRIVGAHHPDTFYRVVAGNLFLIYSTD